MHLNLSSMVKKNLCTNVVYPVVCRHVSSTQQAVTARATARSFLVRFLETRRRKVQHDDIRLEPYLSKGVYTESGAIRPMPKRYPLGIVKVLFVTIPSLYLGAFVSKYAASFLEKMDFFVYNDDDDDDD